MCANSTCKKMSRTLFSKKDEHTSSILTDTNWGTGVLRPLSNDDLSLVSVSLVLLVLALVLSLLLSELGNDLCSSPLE